MEKISHQKTQWILTIFLLQNGYEMDENDLISLTEEVVNNNFEATEISEKISKLIRPINQFNKNNRNIKGLRQPLFLLYLSCYE